MATVKQVRGLHSKSAAAGAPETNTLGACLTFLVDTRLAVDIQSSLMGTEEYKRMLAEMRKELESLLEDQEDIEQKIAQLRQAIISLAPLAKERNRWWDSMIGEALGLGITDNIRQILRAAYPKTLTPVEIKEQLKAAGQDLSAHTNVMASIHSTLKRMLENKEIKTDDEGLTYRWRRRFQARHRRLARAMADPTAGMTHPTIGTWLALNEPKKDETK